MFNDCQLNCNKKEVGANAAMSQMSRHFFKIYFALGGPSDPKHCFLANLRSFIIALFAFEIVMQRANGM